jgi:hypothetical protein
MTTHGTTSLSNAEKDKAAASFNNKITIFANLAVLGLAAYWFIEDPHDTFNQLLLAAMCMVLVFNAWEYKHHMMMSETW